MSAIYDAIIVGAGPAGASAAFYLGEAGLNVLVLEKENIPRYKTCGGGISIRFLEKYFPFPFTPVIDTFVQSMTYVYHPHLVSIPIPDQVVGMVMRSRLDSYILSHARAEVRQGAAVKTITETADRVWVETKNGDRWAGRYLIGADGANSIVARQAGLAKPRRMAAALEIETPVPPEILKKYGDQAVFIFGQISHGYLWIFPKSDHLSIGVAALHPKPGELQAVLQKGMRRFGINVAEAPHHGHPIPIYTGRKPVATQRILLAGDAAGLVDPLSGEGIRYAVKSGYLASRAILSGKPESYASAIDQQMGINHTISLPIAKVFYRLQRICLALGAPNPLTTQIILNLLADEASTPSVMFGSIATLPLFALTETIAGAASLVGRKKQAARLRSLVYRGLRPT